ncbi:MAG: YggS family pyridoxal phosphate-dependent enzyme [Candidatus Eisenbacteria bacterium]|nr:YggS family pyridoxal phosphate-dependent enzyme [Candidatus Eisenbacteria bacterium]
MEDDRDGIGSLASRYRDVRRRVEEAASRAGRDPAEITLIAVTKTFPSSAAREAFALGIADVGEDRVQELLRKREECADLPLRWHLIGHLQSNKAAKILPAVSMVHSVDSIPLAERLSELSAADRPLDILLQVNTSGEESKFGVAPGEARRTAEAIASLPSLRLRGLMTLGPLTDDQGAIRSSFATLRRIRDEEVRPRVPLASFLSMGMSGDFEIAIEEGATHIRLGTILFGQRG